MPKLPANPEPSTTELNRQTIERLKHELGKCHQTTLQSLEIAETLYETNAQLTTALTTQAALIKELHEEIERAAKAFRESPS